VLSVVVPVYDEIRTIGSVLARLSAALPHVAKQIIVVDDGSTDGTRDWLTENFPGGTWTGTRIAVNADGMLDFAANDGAAVTVQVTFHDANRGKGAALRTAFAAVTGDVVVIQDADLEYDPRDIPTLIQPILDGNADVVFGSRFIGGSHRVLYFWHMVVNRGLTLLSNMFNDLNLTDIEICYKAFRADVARALQIEESRFGVEPELTAKVAKMRLRIYEVPVSYRGRTYEEGKKIGWKDGVRAVYAIVKYGLRPRSPGSR